MQYPVGFPPEWVRALDVARTKAGIKLRQTLAALPARSSLRSFSRHDPAWDDGWRPRARAAQAYVEDVVAALGHHAGEPGQPYDWPLSELLDAVDEFVARQLIPTAFELAEFSAADEWDLEELRERLLERIHQGSVWQHFLTAFQTVADHIDHGGVLEPVEPRAPSSAKRPADVPPPLTLATTVANDPEIDRRLKMLEDYKTAAGKTSIRAICRAAEVASGEFYKWKNGTLQRQSVTAKKLEQFLVAKKAPPKRPPRA
jgi:hypothetical protein